MAQLVAACGASSVAARPAVCKLKAQQAIARDLGIKPGSIAYTHSIANNAMPQCAFRARAGGRKVVVTVNVDNGPQPYFRLGRTINEATQIFGAPPPGFRAPEGLSGLFPFASWFPNTDQLMAMNYRVLVTVTVGWPGAGRNAEVAVARAAAVPYLPRPHGPLNAILYP
ncbi:MAG TPA: hypothetical protein VKS25_16095 [Solirubrobacteraceae bacterium]|nr:hypothetical protein [Solirubrobacteraceae bacterium]